MLYPWSRLYPSIHDATNPWLQSGFPMVPESRSLIPCHANTFRLWGFASQEDLQQFRNLKFSIDDRKRNHSPQHCSGPTAPSEPSLELEQRPSSQQPSCPFPFSMTLLFHVFGSSKWWCRSITRPACSSSFVGSLISFRISSPCGSTRERIPWLNNYLHTRFHKMKCALFSSNSGRPSSCCALLPLECGGSNQEWKDGSRKSCGWRWLFCLSTPFPVWITHRKTIQEQFVHLRTLKICSMGQL